MSDMADALQIPSDRLAKLEARMESNVSDQRSADPNTNSDVPRKRRRKPDAPLHREPVCISTTFSAPVSISPTARALIAHALFLFFDRLHRALAVAKEPGNPKDPRVAPERRKLKEQTALTRSLHDPSLHQAPHLEQRGPQKDFREGPPPPWATLTSIMHPLGLQTLPQHPAVLPTTTAGNHSAKVFPSIPPAAVVRRLPPPPVNSSTLAFLPSSSSVALIRH